MDQLIIVTCLPCIIVALGDNFMREPSARAPSAGVKKPPEGGCGKRSGRTR